MGWNPIGVDGRFAKLLSSVTGRSVEELDALDGKKDGQLPAPSILQQSFPSRVATFAKPDINGFVIDDGDGKIDGDDVILIQIGDWQRGWGADRDGEFWYVGGCLSHLESGYYETNEHSSGVVRLPSRQYSFDPHTLEKKLPQEIWDEIQRRRLTLFSSFTTLANDILKEVVKKGIKY